MKIDLDYNINNMETRIDNKCKAFTSLEQSKKLAKFLPLESADMVLPFRHAKNNEYIPGYVVSRNYVEVYNDMMKLPGMEKEDVCKLIQPSWSLAALLNILPDRTCVYKKTYKDGRIKYQGVAGRIKELILKDNPIDACVAMIERLHELKML